MDIGPKKKKAPSLWDLAQLARARKAAGVEAAGAAGAESSGLPPNPPPPPSSTAKPAVPQSLPADVPRNVVPIAPQTIKNVPTKPSPPPVDNFTRPNVDAPRVSSPLYTTVREPTPTAASRAPPTTASRALPTEASRAPPTTASRALPTEASRAPPTEASRAPPTEASRAPPTEASRAPPTAPPISKPTSPPISKPTSPPISKPTSPPISNPTSPPLSQPIPASSRTGSFSSSIPYNASTNPSNLPPKLPSNLPPKLPSNRHSPDRSAQSPKRARWDSGPAHVPAPPPPTSRDTDDHRGRPWPEISPPSRAQLPDAPRDLEYVHPSRLVQYSAPVKDEPPRSYREPYDERREYEPSRRDSGGRVRGSSRSRGNYNKDDRRPSYHQDERRPSYHQDERRPSYHQDERRPSYHQDERRPSYHQDERQPSFQKDEREPGWNQWVSSSYPNGVRSPNPASPTVPASKRTRWDPAPSSGRASPRDTDVHRRISLQEDERRTIFEQEQRRPSFPHDERRTPHHHEERRGSYHKDDRRTPGNLKRPDDRSLNLLRPPPQKANGGSELSSQEEGEIREPPTSHAQEPLPNALGFHFQMPKQGTPSRSPSPPKRPANPLLNRRSPPPHSTSVPPILTAPSNPPPARRTAPPALTPSTPLFSNSTSFVAPATSESVKPITAAALSGIRIKKRKPAPTPTGPPTAPLDPATEATLYERRPTTKRPRTTPLPGPALTRFYDRNPKPFTRTDRQMWLDILRDLRTLQAQPAREIDWTRLREHFQTAPYSPIDDNLHTKLQDILRDFVAAGPSIVYGNDDIFLDAKYLYTKWARGDDTTSIMRGVQTKKRPGKAWSDSFDPSFVQLRRQADYVGEGELVCGQWWPKQMCCVFDGAHGSHEAGITAISTGAVSVVLSGGHNNEYADVDELDVVRYCGTKGVRDPHGGDIGVKSSATQSLFDSMENRQPVRLIRSSKSKGKEREGAEVIAPFKGFRYDGLYEVTEVETLSERFAMFRFVLRRQPGQVPVRYKGVGKKPNTQDLLNWNREENMGVAE